MLRQSLHPAIPGNSHTDTPSIRTRLHVVYVHGYTWYTRVVRQYLAIEGGVLVHYSPNGSLL